VVVVGGTVVVVVVGGTVVVVVVGGTVVVVVVGGTVVVVVGGGLLGALVVVVVVGLELVGLVVGAGAGFKTRADAEAGGAAARAAPGVFKPARSWDGNAKFRDAAPRFLPGAKEGSVDGSAAELVDGSAADAVVGEDAFVSLDPLGAAFDGSVSFWKKPTYASANRRPRVTAISETASVRRAFTRWLTDF
jgi:hypothetical protein